MMDPITDGDTVLDSLPPPSPTSPPPPPPMSPPPISTTPPPKPRKTSRSISSPKNAYNDTTSPDRPVSPVKNVQIVAAKEKSNGLTNGASRESLDDSSDNYEGKMGRKSVHEDDLNGSFPGGVAKIIGEIEKFNSLGRRGQLINGNDTDEETQNNTKNNQRNDDSHQLYATPRRINKSNSSSQGHLSPIEKSVLREMPIDVEIDATEAARPPRGGHNLSGGEESPRKGGVKRTPTMEFKKQCSKIGRIRTKILQNLGKADKTTDEVFDEYEANFNRQQANASRLHREVANYIRCARALHGASKALFETLQEVYEPEWAGSELIYGQAQSSDMLWTDFVHKLQEGAMTPLTTYTSQFPELRKKIDKRGRKLVDYDSMRHQVEALQKSQKRDEYKMARGRDQLELARTTFDALNKELYAQLPGVHDERVSRTANTIASIAGAEGAFMREAAKISSELELISEKLSSEEAKGTYRTARGEPITPRPISMHNQSTVPREEVGRPYEEIQFEEPKVNGEIIHTKVPSGANTGGLPTGVLYQVRTTYKYDREDLDELSFDTGEVINVVEYEDPEEMEEGWLCGYKTNPSEKGLFPANFTRPL